MLKTGVIAFNLSVILTINSSFLIKTFGQLSPKVLWLYFLLFLNISQCYGIIFIYKIFYQNFLIHSIKILAPFIKT